MALPRLSFLSGMAWAQALRLQPVASSLPCWPFCSPSCSTATFPSSPRIYSSGALDDLSQADPNRGTDSFLGALIQ